MPQEDDKHLDAIRGLTQHDMEPLTVPWTHKLDRTIVLDARCPKSVEYTGPNLYFVQCRLIRGRDSRRAANLQIRRSQVIVLILQLLSGRDFHKTDTMRVLDTVAISCMIGVEQHHRQPFLFLALPHPFVLITYSYHSTRSRNVGH